jgi:hypothetical protein
MRPRSLVVHPAFSVKVLQILGLARYLLRRLRWLRSGNAGSDDRADVVGPLEVGLT